MEEATKQEKVKRAQATIEEFIGDPAAELVPELQRCLFEGDEGIVYIKHPLINTSFHTAMFNDQVNRRLAAKQKALTEARKEKRWGTVIGLHERPWRLDALRSIEDDLSDAEFWEHLGATWIDSDNIWEMEEQWIELLSSDRPERERMMDEDERAILAKLPEVINVFRGFNQDHREGGLSYTLESSRAEWFALRHRSIWPDAEPRVAVATIERKNVLAYFNGRDEQEIIGLPGSFNISDFLYVNDPGDPE